MLALAILHDCADPERAREESRRIWAADCDELELDNLGWLVWKPKGKLRRRVSPNLVRMVVEQEPVQVVETETETETGADAETAEVFEVLDRQAHYSVQEPKKRGRPRKTVA